MRLKAICRIAAVALLAMPLIPLQWLAVRRDWALARRLPVFFHRSVLAIIGVRVAVNGTQARQRPLLIVANHVSWLDIPVVSALSPVVFVAKSEVAGWPVLGWLAKLQRTVFINRQARHQTGAATSEIAGDSLYCGRPLSAMIAWPASTKSTARTVPGAPEPASPWRRVRVISAGWPQAWNVET